MLSGCGTCLFGTHKNKYLQYLKRRLNAETAVKTLTGSFSFEQREKMTEDRNILRRRLRVTNGWSFFFLFVRMTFPRFLGSSFGNNLVRKTPGMQMQGSHPAQAAL